MVKTTIEAAGATVDCTGDTVYVDRRPTTDRIFAEGSRWLWLSSVLFSG
jgi:hypothetical protein